MNFMHRSLYPRKRSPVPRWDPQPVCTPWRRQNLLLLQGIERRFFGCPARKLVTISTTLILQLSSLNVVTTKPYSKFNALELNTWYRLLVNWTAEIVKRQCTSQSDILGHLQSPCISSLQWTTQHYMLWWKCLWNTGTTNHTGNRDVISFWWLSCVYSAAK
jgi:hypothetical protein